MAEPNGVRMNSHPGDSSRFVAGLGPLTDLVIERLRVSDDVAAAKFGTGQPIDAPAREKQELDEVRRQAAILGLDRDATVVFFQNQITASKIVQRGLFRRWAERPDLVPATRPDLAEIRERLDRLTTELLKELVATDAIRRPTAQCRARLLVARLSGQIANHLDELHRHALAAALASVCSPA